LRGYDVVIVGARCAGATLATFLARAGARVLLLDRAGLPSDQLLSTHSIHPPGMDVLDEVGVGPAVRAVAPASRIVRMRVPQASLEVEFPEGRAEYCPRRKRLDGLLQQAAVSAGAELFDHTKVVSLIQENGRVSGVRTTSTDGGGDRTFSASLTVGADGRYSTVARLVAAGEYLGYDAPRAMYWGYWNAPSFWRTDPAYRFGMYFSWADSLPRVIFQTDHDQLMLGCCPPSHQTDAWRADPAGTLRAALAAEPVIGPLIGDSEPDGAVRGTVRERFFFRRAVGDGWALVGDAGHHKEVLLGDGITEAVLQAKSLAAAISQESGAALTRWWRARDVLALPLYYWGMELAALEPPWELHWAVFSHFESHPELKQRFIDLLERKLSPFDLVPAPRMLGWVAGAVARGRWRILPELVATTRRAVAMKRELRGRSRLLAEAEAAAG